MCASVSVDAEGNTSATEAHERLMLSSHWNTAAAEVSLCYCYKKVRGNTSATWFFSDVAKGILLDLSLREKMRL